MKKKTLAAVALSLAAIITIPTISKSTTFSGDKGKVILSQNLEEKLNYTASSRRIPLGKAQISLNKHNKDYSILVSFNSSWLFDLHYTISSFGEVKDGKFSPKKHTRKKRRNSINERMETEFDYKNFLSTAYYYKTFPGGVQKYEYDTRGSPVQILNKTKDILSAILDMRFDEVKDIYPIHTLVNGQKYKFNFYYEGKGRLRIDGTSYETYKYSAEIGKEVFGMGGEFSVWVRKGDRIPLKLNLKGGPIPFISTSITIKYDKKGSSWNSW